MNKKGLQFRNAFFAIIILGLVVTSLGIIVSGWSSYYQSGITWNFQEYDKSSEISETVGGYQGVISPKSPETGMDYESNILQSVYGVVNNLMFPFSFVFGESGLIHSAASLFGIPNYIILAIISMMVISIIFAIVAIMFKQFKNTI